MKKRGALIYLICLAVISLLVPAYVIKTTVDMKSGWNGLVWGRTENQVKEWIRKNNSNYTLAKCTQSHYGVVCWKLSWKNASDSPMEYIEFQFKDGKLCAVIETERVVSSDPFPNGELGQPEKGSDIKTLQIKEKGVRFNLTERAFYYIPEVRFKATKQRVCVSRLVKNALNKEDVPEEVLSWRVTRGFYTAARFEEVKNSYDDFPAAHF